MLDADAAQASDRKREQSSMIVSQQLDEFLSVPLVDELWAGQDLVHRQAREQELPTALGDCFGNPCDPSAGCVEPPQPAPHVLGNSVGIARYCHDAQTCSSTKGVEEVLVVWFGQVGSLICGAAGPDHNSASEDFGDATENAGDRERVLCLVEGV